MSKSIGKLFLIPCTLGGENTDIIPLASKNRIVSLDHFVVERIRTARRFIRQLSKEKSIDKIQFEEWDKRGENSGQIKQALSWLKSGKDVGLMSEAGAPCIADPGNLLVEAAHKIDIDVVPMVGPSSIFLALMSSGMNGQNFAFTGYLPVKKDALLKALSRLESIAIKNKQTQMFMETPYRNDALWEAALSTLKGSTRLGYAVDLTLDTQEIKVKSVSEWKKTNMHSLHKRPAIFMLSAQ